MIPHRLFSLSLLLLYSLFALTKAQSALPNCSYDELLTKHQSLNDWALTVLDPIYKLPANYAPTDLISLRSLGIDSDKEVRKIVADDLLALLQAASEAGHPLAIQSAYRSYTYQEQTFSYWVAQEGKEAALRSSARAGHSEHQLGTALDFRSLDGPPAWELEDWASTPAGAWLVEHAWQYGFVMSYPRAKEDITCYIYEPWHYRYLGKERARALKESGLTLREWLWQQQ